MRISLVVLFCLSCTGCGFLDRPRLCEGYMDNCWPDDDRVTLVTWPFHLAMLTACAAGDQTIRTFESLPPAAGDAYDYFRIRARGNNVMFERTVAVPKMAATPAVFCGSYLCRWFVPDAPPFSKRGAW